MKNYLDYLFSLESKGIKLGLERTEKLFYFCQNPQKNFPSIQVIGTNGKGSTSGFLAKLFTIPFFWILNLTGYFTSLVAIKKGYGKTVMSHRIITITLLTGILIGYILGYLIPVR